MHYYRLPAVVLSVVLRAGTEKNDAHNNKIMRAVRTFVTAFLTNCYVCTKAKTTILREGTYYCLHYILYIYIYMYSIVYIRTLPC